MTTLIKNEHGAFDPETGKLTIHLGKAKHQAVYNVALCYADWVKVCQRRGDLVETKQAKAIRDYIEAELGALSDEILDEPDQRKYLQSMLMCVGSDVREKAHRAVDALEEDVKDLNQKIRDLKSRIFQEDTSDSEALRMREEVQEAQKKRGTLYEAIECAHELRMVSEQSPFTHLLR